LVLLVVALLVFYLVVSRPEKAFPPSPTQPPPATSTVVDSDGDGIPDEMELRYGTA